MLDANVDAQVSALGPVPSDMRSLVTRVLGDQPLTLANADVLLASLSTALAGQLPSSPHVELATPGAFTGATAALDASSPVFEPPPLSASAAPLFDSRPPPPSAAPPVFEARSVSADPSSVFDGKPDAETTAQAIFAAFGDADGEASSDLARDPRASLDSRALELEASPSAEIEPQRNARRGATRGSRRPDLHELLNQPLDALDFERSEPVPPDTTDAEGTHSSDVPTGAPPPAASGDDFEILVDDEILEIAEDDVELVDDDSSN